MLEWALICWVGSLVQYLCVFTPGSALLLADSHSPAGLVDGGWESTTQDRESDGPQQGSTAVQGLAQLSNT